MRPPGRKVLARVQARQPPTRPPTPQHELTERILTFFVGGKGERFNKRIGKAVGGGIRHLLRREACAPVPGGVALGGPGLVVGVHVFQAAEERGVWLDLAGGG